MIEAGYRCAVPTCRTVAPLEIEHIDDYAKVGKHEFANMIVLCANCHRMKGSGPRQLDRKALKIIKANLATINHRYNDTERRILEHFTENPEADAVLLPETPVLFGYLIKDGLIEGLTDYHYAGGVGALRVEFGDNQVATSLVGIA
ncbi:HNH endonuclease [Mycolicibacterium conceptionense]|uniref:HNH endonuclease n=1 Tax=Mycolicibacterium conceptionense TaxID=451644 RepID=A0A0U1DRP5_9MYCO|nr:HNH endonuclease [Mycolicibacterium conceptionense]